MLTYPNIRYATHPSYGQTTSEKKCNPLSYSIFEGEVNAITSEILNRWKDESETGGTFYGVKTRRGENIIMLATPPGKKAYHSKYQFKMDLEFLKNIDKNLKDFYKIDHLGDWHSHLIDLSSPSTDDIHNTHKISMKNGYNQYIQLIVTIHGRQNEVKFHPYIYIDAKSGSPHPCKMNILPGKSPIRLALEHDGQIPELTEIYTDNEKQLNMPKSAPLTISSLSDPPPIIEQKLDNRLEKQLLKLPSEVLSRVEIEINQGVTMATIPVHSSNYSLFIAFDEESPSEINSVSFGITYNKLPGAVDSQSLKNDFCTYIKTIWSLFIFFLRLIITMGK